MGPLVNTTLKILIKSEINYSRDINQFDGLLNNNKGLNKFLIPINMSAFRFSPFKIFR